MIIRAFGLFWRSDEIDWNPGRGKRNAFSLLGRQNANSGKIKIADFRHQQGVYILYGNYGPHYVGLTRRQGLGKRLKDHLSDEHKGSWDRFSWFGFQNVLKKKVRQGYQELGSLPKTRPVAPDQVIADIEALLIMAMALRNRANMKFAQAEQWHQVKLDEIAKYTRRL